MSPVNRISRLDHGVYVVPACVSSWGVFLAKLCVTIDAHELMCQGLNLVSIKHIAAAVKKSWPSPNHYHIITPSIHNFKNFAGIDHFGVLTIVRRDGRPRPFWIHRSDGAFRLEQGGLFTESPIKTPKYFGKSPNPSGKSASHFWVPTSCWTVWTMWSCWRAINAALHLIDR